MKKRLETLLRSALERLKTAGDLPADQEVPLQIERTRDPAHGDFAANTAMLLAKSARCDPRRLAEKIRAALPEDPAVIRTEIAGPGFINFFLDAIAQHRVITDIHSQGPGFGRSSIGAGQRVQVEFVSANPTGPLHVGHGRGAAYGAVVADLLEAAGFDVHREYYVNDAGRQMDILAASVWLRYLENCGEVLPFPANGYRGEYVRDIASDLYRTQGERYRTSADQVLLGLPPDEPQGGDKEEYIDAVVSKSKSLLGPERYREVFNAGLDSILDDIRDDLGEFGTHYQEWFSERSLTETGAVERALERLKSSGYVYEKDGAQWFASTRLGDEKDRVLVRENGQTTYFASDVAYHLNKLERGFDRIVNVWGADHHGYIPRVKAAIQALGGDASKLEVLLVQFAVLYRGTERVQMSTRSGEFVTLRQLRNEVGKDAARFFYVMRKSDQHMDFDLKLATSRTNENPVYYVQYAHARVCSVFRQLDEKGWARDLGRGMRRLERLCEPHELTLVASLSRYPEVVEQAALQYAPHHLVHYLRDLAAEFHGYYNSCQFLVEDGDLRDARLNLIDAVRQVIANGLGLLGVSAPETM
ncbi:arginine--tRNA ligase [Methylococcus capsulatus]|mgnify:CR=1 FL=1|uniref:arginine--tRNA ligase n=1 Tax=Methylococcus capsulatus TaxID=414 RepID=UPI001C5302F9|nr:arginine--tRNA ligase [Methylococcus capsulatus]QXP89270.1 arginine--tRNA ligase [Methylococcus capsulatus]